MTTGHVFIATSLDGFVARENHSLDWLPQDPVEGEDPGYDAFMESVDGLIMGRGSFENVLRFGKWPYKKPVIVLSQSLSQTDVPDALQEKVRISKATPQEIMDEVKQIGWKRAYIDGGQIVQSFLRAGLITDMIITVIPVLIGEGRSLFGPLGADLPLKLIHSEAFGSGMVQNFYSVLN